MSHIILTSNAYQVVASIVSELGLTPSEHKVCAITTACNPYKSAQKPTPWLDKDIKALQDAGFRVDLVDIEGMSSSDLDRSLDGCTIVFVAGGNTFYLQNEARKSGFFEWVKEANRRGVVYIGSSAGSILVSQDTRYASSEDKLSVVPGFDDFRGIGLTDIEPWVHIGDDRKFKAKLKQFINQYDSLTKKVFIRNDQALIIKDGWMKYIQSTV